MYRPSYPTYFAASAAWLLALAAGSALAAEATYCVTCKNPDATYRCSVTAGGSKPSDALKLYCVIRTAKEGHHGSCSAVKSDNCNGIEKVYSYDGPMPEDFASDPRVQKFKEKIAREQRAFEKPKSDAPDTLVEMTGRAVSASRNRFRSARDALSGSEESAGQSLPQEDPSLSAAPLSADANAAPAPSTAEANAAERPGFARRSYRCVVSLFRNCSGEAEVADQ
ncbi:MAG: hypothetical protein AB7V40_00625 [Methyloceanibacter sp.]